MQVQVYVSNQTGVPTKPVIIQYVTWYMHAYNLQGGGGMGDNLINEFMMHIFTIASLSCCTVILVSFPLIPVHNIYCLLLQPVHFLRASMNGIQSNYDIHHTIFDIEQYVSFHICILKNTYRSTVHKSKSCVCQCTKLYISRDRAYRSASAPLHIRLITKQ